jgi:hypothetical protein
MSSYKTLLIPIIHELLIKEIGEANITPLKWTRVSPVRYKFLVDIGDFTEVVTVDFEQIEGDIKYIFPPKYRNLDKIYNVGYEVSGTETQFAKTDLKTLLTILSTVVDIIKNFIENNDIDGLYVKGSEKEIGSGNTSQKTNLYKAFISKQLQQIPQFGFDTKQSLTIWNKLPD